MATRAKDACWALAQVLVVICIVYPAFFILAPWRAARAVSEATPAVMASLPAECPAFTVNHGQYGCFWFGTQTQNPVGYFLCTALLTACVAFVLFTGMTGRGIYSLLHGGPRRAS